MWVVCKKSVSKISNRLIPNLCYSRIERCFASLARSRVALSDTVAVRCQVTGYASFIEDEVRQYMYVSIDQ